jgi:hypothetical protein
VERGRGRLRRPFSPEFLDQAVARDDLVGTDEQGSEKCSLTGSAQLDLVPGSADLEWAENAELESNSWRVFRAANLPRRYQKNDP